MKKSVSSVFFKDSKTPEELKVKYVEAQKGIGKLRIMIVAGHDKVSHGAKFENTNEFEINAILAEKLADKLSTRDEIDVFMVRNIAGYNPVFLEYLENNKQEIESFVGNKKYKMENLIDTGEIHSYLDGVPHNVAMPDIIFMLYGVNKMANDIKSDIVLHIHFNDYPRKNMGEPGKYDGFTIYIPERQYSNYNVSKEVAVHIKNSLMEFVPLSSLPKESAGITEDQELIAIGAFNTLEGAGLLMEYGYIYEPELQNEIIQENFLELLAQQTYDGVMAFFDEEFENRKNMDGEYSRFSLSNIKNTLYYGTKDSEEVFLLQATLREKGFYPPSGSSLRECPIIGSYGPCTAKAVSEYAKSLELNKSGRVFDPKSF